MKLLFLSILIIFQSFCYAANTVDTAAPSEKESAIKLDEVIVNSGKDPVEISYRLLLKSLDAYHLHRGLAPAATPKFKVRLQPKQWDAQTDPLILRLIDQNTDLELPIAADKTFSLPRNQQVITDDAKLRLNRSSDKYVFFAAINSPNIPANSRRLGDLRLECEMDSTFVKLNLISQSALTILGNPNPCHLNAAKIFYRAPQRLRGVTLVSTLHHRREPLPSERISRNGLSFAPPLNDQSWPDDALIEFEYASDQP